MISKHLTTITMMKILSTIRLVCTFAVAFADEFDTLLSQIRQNDLESDFLVITPSHDKLRPANAHFGEPQMLYSDNSSDQTINDAQIVISDQFKSSVVVIDGRNSNGKRLRKLLQIAAKALEKKSFKETYILSYYDEAIIEEQVKNADYSMKTAFFYEIGNSFRIDLGCPGQGYKENVANWETDIPLPNVQCEHPFTRRTLNFSTRGLPPYNLYNKSGQIYGGIDIDIMNIIKKKFDFEFRVITEGIMGSVDETTGKWIGVIGAVVEGKSAMGLGNPAIDMSRFQALDYTTTLYALETSVIAAHPQPTPKYLNLLKPFTGVVWLFCGIFLIIITLMFVLIINIMKNKDNRQRSLVNNAALFPFAALTDQSVEDRITLKLASFGGRPMQILLITWITASFILTAAYSCNLKSFLITTDFEKAVETEQDVLNAGKTLFIPRGTSIEFDVKLSPRNVYKELYEHSMANEGLFRITRGWFPEHVLAALSAGSGAVIFPKIVAVMRKNQPYRLSSHSPFYYHCGYLLPKYAVWKQSVDKQLTVLAEMGIIHKLMSQYIPHKRTGTDDQATTQTVFTLEHLLGAYLVLIAGILVAFAILLFECVL